jgi:hypothetical protein
MIHHLPVSRQVGAFSIAPLLGYVFRDGTQAGSQIT